MACEKFALIRSNFKPVKPDSGKELTGISMRGRIPNRSGSLSGRIWSMIFFRQRFSRSGKMDWIVIGAIVTGGWVMLSVLSGERFGQAQKIALTLAARAKAAQESQEPVEVK
jgi:hypothetical protein